MVLIKTEILSQNVSIPGGENAPETHSNARNNIISICNALKHKPMRRILPSSIFRNMSRLPYPKNFTELNGAIECSHLMDTPKVLDGVIEVNNYTRMFAGCPSISFETVIERPEQEKMSEPKKFDDFDWDEDFSEAYKE